MATIKPNLSAKLSVTTDNLYDAPTGTGPGPIQFDDSNLPTATLKKNEIIDYIRLRLGDQIVDVEADKEHFDMGVNQAFQRYRQRAQMLLKKVMPF